MKPVLLAVLTGAVSLFLAGGCTTINCLTDPPGAKVYVNGVYRGTTPFTSTFWIGEQGGATEVVAPGHERTECPHLPLPPPPGTLFMTSAPSGADIIVDGYRVGATPQYVTIDWPHEIMVSWNVRRPEPLLVLPQPRAPEQQQQQQQQQQQSTTVVVPGGGGGGGGEKEAGQGAVIVSATPDNCEVCVDGIFVGNAPANLKLSEGIHILEVKKDGFTTFKRELRVLKGSEVVLRADLQKK